MKWFWIISLLAFLSCQRNETTPTNCGVKKSLRDLPWLKNLIRDDGLGSSIYQGTYQNQTVFAVSRNFVENIVNHTHL